MRVKKNAPRAGKRNRGAEFRPKGETMNIDINTGRPAIDAQASSVGA